MPAVSETLSNDPLARFADGVRVTGGAPVPRLATTTANDFAPPGKRVSKHDSMVAGVRQALATARRGDRVRLWRFANDCAPVACVEDLPGPGGGTEIGRALARVAASGEKGGGKRRTSSS